MLSIQEPVVKLIDGPSIALMFHSRRILGVFFQFFGLLCIAKPVINTTIRQLKQSLQRRLCFGGWTMHTKKGLCNRGNMIYKTLYNFFRKKTLHNFRPSSSHGVLNPFLVPRRLLKKATQL